MSESVTEEGVAQDLVEDSAELEYVEENVPQPNPDFESLRSDVSRMMESINSRFGALEEKLAPKPQAPAPTELNEMLRTDPAAAIAEIVKQQNVALKSEMRGDLDRQNWDARTHQDFPTNDPKFASEMQNVYNYMVGMGLNKNDPKSLYLVAEVAAMRQGVTKKGAKVETKHESAEPPSSSGGTPTKQRGAISDNDPRVRTYMMTNPSKEKLAVFKQKLAAKDKASRAK